MISDAVFRAREAGESRMMDGQHRNEVIYLPDSWELPDHGGRKAAFVLGGLRLNV